LPFPIDVVEPTGAATELFGAVAGERCCVMRNGRSSLKPGTVATLHAAPEHVYLFDAETGRRLR
jgi:multiple sugar transport system ATP-binding protein